MKRFYKFLGLALIAGTFSLSSCQKDGATLVTDTQEQDVLQVAQDNWQIIPGKYVVLIDRASVKKALPANYAQMQAAVRDLATDFLRAQQINPAQLERVYGKAVLGFSVNLSDAELIRVQRNSDVVSVEPDRWIVLPQGKPTGGSGSAAQQVPWGITRVGGGQTYTGSATAWVIDTGIDLDHPDLNVDASRGFTAFTSGRDANFDDGNGHGSHCAGTIAAINNSIGVVGVAAGATVVPVKVLDSRGSGALSGVIAGMDYVASVANNGDVANMSLGGGVSTSIDAAAVALANSGVKVAVAAGNESDDANNHSPARANASNLYTVSAMDVNDNWAYFSNYGNPPVDYCAPGYSIYSTYKGGGYSTLSGTSMATPHVAGLLLWGNLSFDGYVNGDPDGNADKIAHR